MTNPPPEVALDATIRKTIDSETVVVFSLSGGKDSTAAAIAASDYLDNIGHPMTNRFAIHADLGQIEWPETPRFVEEIAGRLQLPLIVVRRNGGGMIERWYQRWESSKRRYIDLETYQLVSPWSSAALRFCTAELKVAPINRELKRRFAGRTIISVIGIRREESAARAKAPISRRDLRSAPEGNRAGTIMLAWHPIVEWKTDQVFARHGQANLPLHSAYSAGSTRLSCAYCVLSSINNLEVAASQPGNLDALKRITDLELDSAFAFQPSRWLTSVAPHEIENAERRLGTATRLRELRASLEGRLPKDLMFKRGWPPRIPSQAEARAIANVRGRLLAEYGWKNRYPEAEAIRGRFEELHSAQG